MGGETVIRLFQGSETPHLYFTCSVLYKGNKYSADIRADDDNLQELFQSIRSSNIPPIVKCDIGLDGDSYELTIRDDNGSAYATYHWWMTPEKGWHPLLVTARTILHLGRQVSSLIL